MFATRNTVLYRLDVLICLLDVSNNFVKSISQIISQGEVFSFKPGDMIYIAILVGDGYGIITPVLMTGA